MTNNKRINYLDVVKGLGILFVILGHIFPHPLIPSFDLGTYIYYFHMPLFL